MQEEDKNKKRSDEDIHEYFIKEIKKSRLKDVDYLFINLYHTPKNQSYVQRRIMFYEFKDKKLENFKALVYDKLDSSLNGKPIKATKLKILIEDQEDMYGAILIHANDTTDKQLDVYLENSGYPYDYE